MATDLLVDDASGGHAGGALLCSPIGSAAGLGWRAPPRGSTSARFASLIATPPRESVRSNTLRGDGNGQVSG
jgi:hypothetical protein